MSLEEYIIFVYIWVSENYKEATKGKILRRAGFAPKLSDEEVITMELVGEYLGIDTDKDLWKYFKDHWISWFPSLCSRSQFSKQSANLFPVKQKLHILLVKTMHYSDIHIIDGFPIPICHIVRSFRCKKFKGVASIGYCAAKKEKYYGFKGHLLIDTNGVIVGLSLATANIDEREVLWDFSDYISGLLLGDKGYIKKPEKEELQENNINLQTPLRKNMEETRSPSLVKAIMRQRRLIETVISQLTERFHISKVWARDMWHLTSRINRKLMAHTMAVMANFFCNKKFIALDELIK